MTSWRRRAIYAVLVVVLLTGSVTVILASAAPNESSTPFVVERPNWIPWPLELSYLDYPNRAGIHNAQIELHMDRTERLLAHDRIRILLGTYLTEPTLMEARLRVRGTQCDYVTPPGARFINNGLLTFVASGGCKSRRGSASGQLDLFIRFDGPGRIAVWGWGPTTPLVSDSPIWVLGRPGGPVLRGEYVDELPGPPVFRLTLLAFVWQLGGSRWIAGVLMLSAALAAAAVFLLPTSIAATQPARALAVRAAAANGCFAAALALAYAIVIPPFQAADEPHHFMAFAELPGASAIADEAARWAQLTHFRRIRFRADQKFLPVHMTVPGDPWGQDDATVPDSSARGGGIETLWRWIARVFGQSGAPVSFLALRLTNVVLFVLSVAASTWFAVLCARGPLSALLVTTAFLVPTLPFFSMHVSNHAPLVSLYVLMGAAVVVIVSGDDRARFAGVVLGGAFAAATAISRSAIPLTPFMASVLACRAIVGGHSDQWSRALRSAAWFWGGLALAAVVILVSAPTDTSMLRRLAGSLDAWQLHAAIFAGAGLGMLAELAAHGLRRRRPLPQIDGVAATLALAAVVAIVVMLAGSIVGEYPILRSVSGWHPDPEVYARRTLAVALTPFRLRQHDPLMAASFWTGFGWIETRPPEMVISVLSVVSAGSLMVLLVTAAARRETRRILALAVLFVGFLASIAAYATGVVTVSTEADLHGRYLFGLYLCVLMVIWSPWGSISATRPRQSSRPLALLAGCAALHGFCLSFIILRYF